MGKAFPAKDLLGVEAEILPDPGVLRIEFHEPAVFAEAWQPHDWFAISLSYRIFQKNVVVESRSDCVLYVDTTGNWIADNFETLVPQPMFRRIEKSLFPLRLADGFWGHGHRVCQQ